MIHYNLAHVYRGIRKIDDAIRHYQSTIEIDPNDGAAHRDLGTCLMMKKEMNQAIRCFQKAIEINPDDSLAYNNIGSALISL